MENNESIKRNQTMERVAAINSADGRPRLALVNTYGCQQNEADSEKIRGMLASMGYGFTRDERMADVIVINTCAVREHAEMRVYGNVGTLTHAKAAKPDMVIALCGCMMQQKHVAEKIKNSFRHVDLVFGTHELKNFPMLLEQVLTNKKRVFAVSDANGEITEGLPEKREGGVKAWLSVMYGCNNFCSYCVVPYVRGRERSRRAEDVIRDAAGLIESGVKDLTLLGQNVNSYSGGMDFPELIREIDRLDGDFVLRFMTSHPKDAGEKLFAAMAESSHAARHIHLPFQAGNNRVLKQMNRKYTRESYLALVELARRYMPELVLTSDVIVGFPGETEKEFEDTLSLIETVKFDALFTFIYSPRVGTPAAEMPDPATKQEKQAWFDRLLKVQDAISAEKHRAYVGTVQRVLVDGTAEGEYGLTSRTGGGRLVHLKGPTDIVGRFAQVRITDSSTWALFGELER